MFFFNLTAAEFFALFGALSSVVVALYLLDRSRRRQVVATLRFWRQTEEPTQRKHRRKIQQPWSLILQLAAITLLLLAIAQLRIGSPDRHSRDHVLLMDASAWMGARAASGRTLIEEARMAALRYVHALPSTDRVMLVRSDALATPVTGFETNRQALDNAIRHMQPGTAALNLGLSLDFAAQAVRLEGRRAGEIVYAGAGRLAPETLAEMPALPANLRVLPVPSEVENCGLRKLSLRRAAADPELWEAYVTARNYGARPRTLPLTVSFGGAPVATRRLTLAPGTETSLSFEFRTRAAGWLEARLRTSDALPADDIVTFELPAEQAVRVLVYSQEPDLLRPLLAANPHVETVFRRPGDYQPDPKAGIVILDRFRPPQPVSKNAIYIEPPAAGSPAAVRAHLKDATLRWRSDQFLAAGLRTHDTRIESTQVFASAEGDIPIAEVDGGPAILARPGKTKTAVFGFHPLRSALQYELATPLVFANVLKWMAPEIFLRVELESGSIGAVTVPLEADYDPASVRVVADEKLNLPFTIRNRTLRFFCGAPGIVRVVLGDRQMVYSLNLPEIAAARWTPPKSVRTGLAGVGGVEDSARDIWQWLALLGALMLALEWTLFARSVPLWMGRTGLVLRIPFARREEQRRKAS
ncbi:MAG: VWA domain-containing protein [Acidobacteria bacterium]|nr:VWA domain-containing protein [Acidobacteriota bacterium]